MTLKDLQVGERAEVTAFSPGCPQYRARLLAMGLTRGTLVELIRVAPMGDPVEIELRGFRLTLRRDEAEVVLVEPLGNHPHSSADESNQRGFLRRKKRHRGKRRG